VEDVGACGQRALDRPVRRVIVEDVNLSVGQLGAKVADDFGDGHLFVVAGNQNGDSVST
jgi:hypothetical protein